jgi:hypothetical protein
MNQAPSSSIPPFRMYMQVLCGEAVLFGMDFAVNQRASGIYVYRIYDDFWFLHHDASVCAAAWKEMKKYAELVGINFNMKKTGGVCVGNKLEPSLPSGVVGWGFLVFDGVRGRFVIDQAAVDTHIAELKRQLDNAKSVFGYVNALNKVRNSAISDKLPSPLRTNTSSFPLFTSIWSSSGATLDNRRHVLVMRTRRK